MPQQGQYKTYRKYLTKTKVPQKNELEVPIELGFCLFRRQGLKIVL